MKKSNLSIFSYIMIPLFGICVLSPLFFLTTCSYDLKHTNITNYIGNVNGTNWKGYISGSLECETYDTDNDGIDDSSLIKSENQNYFANNLIIPDFVKIGKNVYPLKKINNSAFDSFYGNDVRGTLIINDTIISIGEYAFWNQQGIKEIIFGKSINEIRKAAFVQTKIKKIIFPSLLKKTSIDSFFGCDELEFISFNEDLEEIGTCSFQNCFSLMQPIKIPKSVKTIRWCAFLNTNLSGEIRVYESTIIEEYAFPSSVTIVRYGLIHI